LSSSQKKPAKEKDVAQSPLLIPLISHSWLLSGEFLAPASPDAAVARVEFDCVGRLNGFILHSSFSEEVK